MRSLTTPRPGRFFSAALLLAAVSLSACVRVSSDGWFSDGSDVRVGDVRLVFQFAVTKHGLTSGGPPFRLQMTAGGQRGYHEALVVHSIHVSLDDGREMEITDARQRTLPFGDVEVILDFYGAFVRFADAVPFETEPDRKLTVRADVTVTTVEGPRREVVEVGFHPIRVRRWASVFELATS